MALQSSFMLALLLLVLYSMSLQTEASTWTRYQSDNGPSPRMDHVLLGGGNLSEIYVYGGWGGPSRFLGDLWAANLTSGGKVTWTNLTDAAGNYFPIGRADHSSIVYSSQLISFGGGSYPSDTLNNDVVIYNVTSKSWSVVKTVDGKGPTPRNTHSAVLYDDAKQPLMIVFGGNTGALNALTNEVWIYDLEKQTWKEGKSSESGESSPEGLMWHSATQVGTDMYVFGGLTNLTTGAVSDQLWRYEVKADQWSLVQVNSTVNPVGRAGHSMIAYKDIMYMFGGQGEGSTELFSDTWSFNPSTGNWTQLLPSAAPTPRLGHKAACMNGKFVIFGGTDVGAYPNHPLNDVWVYDL